MTLLQCAFNACTRFVFGLPFNIHHRCFNIVCKNKYNRGVNFGMPAPGILQVYRICQFYWPTLRDGGPVYIRSGIKMSNSIRLPNIRNTDTDALDRSNASVTDCAWSNIVELASTPNTAYSFAQISLCHFFGWLWLAGFQCFPFLLSYPCMGCTVCLVLEL